MGVSLDFDIFCLSTFHVRVLQLNNATHKFHNLHWYAQEFLSSVGYRDGGDLTNFHELPSPRNRGGLYVHCVMHKCITIKLGENENT